MREKKVSEIFEILDLLIKPEEQLQIATPMLMGNSGIGKSEIVKQFAEKNNLNCIDLRLSLFSDAADTRGIPVPKNNKVSWLPADFLPFNGSKFENTSGILFLDEINRAQFEIIQSIFQLVYDRRVGDNELLDSWYIVCAGNLGIDDDNDVIEFDAALNDRLVKINMKFSFEEWKIWAIENHVHYSVIGFLSKYPEYALYKIDDQERKHVTPRTWVRMSNIIKNNKNKSVLEIVRLVGESVLNGVTPKFMEYIKNMSKYTGKDIIERYCEIKNTMFNDGFNLRRDFMMELVDEIIMNKDLIDSEHQYENICNFCVDFLSLDHMTALISKFYVDNNANNSFYDYIVENFKKEINDPLCEAYIAKFDEYELPSIPSDEEIKKSIDVKKTNI